MCRFFFIFIHIFQKNDKITIEQGHLLLEEEAVVKVIIGEEGVVGGSIPMTMTCRQDVVIGNAWR